MNLAALFARYKMQLAVGGAGVAVLLGLKAHKKGGGAAAGKTTMQPAATYDSTSNDLYNSIEPQISWLAQQIAALKAAPSSPIASQPGGAGNAPVHAPQLPAGYVPPAGHQIVQAMSPDLQLWFDSPEGMAAFPIHPHETRGRANRDGADRITGSPGLGTSGGVRNA